MARDYAREAGLSLRRDAESTSGWLLDGKRGGLLARGVGEGLTGQGLQFLAVDDPHKDRGDAESPAQRKAVTDWFRSTALTRLHPGCGCLVVHTRWHPEDLTGILGAEGWEVVNLEAIRPDGAALWEAQRPLSFLEKRRADIGEYDWASLYMGQPRPRGGAVFHDAWYYDDPPKDGYRVSIGIDLAYSAKTSADYSVRLDLAEKGGVYYVLGLHRAQCEARQFASALGSARAQYPAARMLWYSAGAEKGVADLLNTMVPALRLEAQAAVSDKFVRAQPVAAAWNAGKVLLPRSAPWVPALLSEVLGFTGQGDAHDDMVDALAAAFDCFAKPQVWWQSADAFGIPAKPKKDEGPDGNQKQAG